MPTVPADLATLHLLRLLAENTPLDAEDALTLLVPEDLRRLLFARDLTREQKGQLARRLPPKRVWRELKPGVGGLLAFAQVAAEDALEGCSESRTDLAEILGIEPARVHALLDKHAGTRGLDGPTVAARALVADVVGLSERRLRQYVDTRVAGTRHDPRRSEARQWLARVRRWRAKAAT